MTNRQSLRAQLSTLRIEPGRSRLSLLVCALSVSLLSLLSTISHTERPVAVAMQRDQARVWGASVFSLRTAQTTGSELIGKLGRMMRRRP